MFVHLVLIKLKPGIARSDSRVRAWELEREVADWLICDYEVAA
jgi:hypothetical protein